MATTLTVTKTSRAGFDFTANSTAADGTGNNWVGTGAEWLVVNNAGGSSITLTLVGGVGWKIDTTTPANETVTVTNGHLVIVGPFPPNLFNDSNGKMNVTWSAVTSVTVALMALGT